jgi:glycosyltransferase involved in cell wall biosynthesis
MNIKKYLFETIKYALRSYPIIRPYILFTPGDKKKMADAIKSMVGNPQIGKSKGNASREKAVRYYPDNVASELIEIYNGILTAD